MSGNQIGFDSVFLETVEHKSTACRNALLFTVVGSAVTGFHGFLSRKSKKIHFGGATPHIDFGPAPNPCDGQWCKRPVWARDFTKIIKIKESQRSVISVNR